MPDNPRCHAPDGRHASPSSTAWKPDARRTRAGTAYSMTSRFSPLRVFLAATVILVSLGLYVVANAIQFASDYRMVTHTYVVLRTLDHIESLKHQAVAESRGYLLAGRAD